MTCNAYAIDKFRRAFINAAKICFFASFLPLVARKKKKLFKSGLKTGLQTLKLILIRYLQASMFLVLGTSLPFILVCQNPFCKDPLVWLSFGQRACLSYALFPIMCLIVDVPSKMPSYMGFFVSKAISQAWALMKYFDMLPQTLPLEKQIGFALLAGLIGFVSVKRAKIEGAKKLKEQEEILKNQKQEEKNAKLNNPYFYSSCIEGGP